MDISTLDKSKDGMKVSFLVRGVTAAYANALRRAILEEVPTMAIEEVEFRKNSSILYDEMIAHRMGMIPLKTDLKSYRMIEPGKEPGKANQVHFTLKTTRQGMIYAEDLKSDDDAITPVYPKLPITKLMKGQTLELEATAILGKGKMHSKWCPGHVYYYNEAKITVNNDDKLLAEMKDRYPKQIFDKSGKIDRNLINSPELIDACDGVSKLVDVERKDDSYVFVLESWGQLPPKTILQEAIKQITDQLEEIAKLMK